MTDPEAKKVIDENHNTWPIAKAARHFLRRFLDAQGTIRASKAIIEALRDEVIKRGGKA